MFGAVPIDKEKAFIGYRLQIVPQAIEKRGMRFLAQDNNWTVCCCLECKRDYEEFWKFHPRRKELIGILEKNYGQ